MWLTQADFSYANLIGVDLNQANLRGAAIADANLIGTVPFFDSW
jgi:uncharacterized protein YjbI with pentapeptide repeats